MTDKPRINENAVKRKLHPSSGIAVDIEYIEKTLTKTWSLNRMEASRYAKQMRDNTYVWLTDLVQEVKELREVKCEAESLIQQKDAEIAELKRLAKFWESQYSDASTHGDETEERLNAEIARLTDLLQGKGDTP
jgi:hypothetical protein